ncbi:MAG TPA: hypothetical protein PKK06_16445 [Phycisphaerae bacterium]|nr:hypothetical protein [Phycisphaerae bacterium]HNU46791.1 hypothetical protein [Phycisphaerae bacterium]
MFGLLDRSTSRTVTHVALGVVRASLETPVQSLHDGFRRLYRPFVTEDAGGDAIRVRVMPGSLHWGHRRRFRVTADDRLRFEPVRSDELLPRVEWAINWEVPASLPHYLHLHASSLEVNGCGVILPGHSGSGKSTLALALLTRGWRYLCDEFALIQADSLLLDPFPRAVCIKRPGYPVIESLGVRLTGRPHYVKGSKGYVRFVHPLEVREDAIGRRCPVRYVIFPTYVEDAEPALAPLSRAEAAFAMHQVCFNLFGCRRLGLDVLAEVVRGAECYRLTSGDIHRTCALLERLVGGSAQQVVRSA